MDQPVGGPRRCRPPVDIRGAIRKSGLVRCVGKGDRRGVGISDKSKRVTAPGAVVATSVTICGVVKRLPMPFTEANSD